MPQEANDTIPSKSLRKDAETAKKRRQSTPGGSTMRRVDSHVLRRIREADRVSVVRHGGVRLDDSLELALETIEKHRDDPSKSVRVEVSIGQARNHKEDN